MNITSATNSGSQFLSLDSENVSHGGVTSMSGELAVLMLENQEQQKDIAREELASARHDFSEALADEVQALRDQADAAFRGAIFTGAMSLAGSGLQVWGTARDCKEVPWQTSVGAGLNKLAEPLGGMVGKTYAAADAKAAAGVQQSAKWQMDDARDARAEAGKLQDKALDWVSSMADRDAATTAAILANKV
jgi:hypothetical protein